MTANRLSAHFAWILVLSVCLAGSVAGEVERRWASHGPYGGTINDLVASTHAGGGVYACVPCYGVCRAAEGESRWVNGADGIEDPYINVMAEDPTNPNILYAGSDSGMYKSTDGGAHWTNCEGGVYCASCLAIAIDPTDPLTIYSGAIWAGDYHVYKSTDGAQSWQAAHAGIPNGAVMTALAIDPVDTDVVYVATQDQYGYAPESVGIYKTTNGGATWAPAGEGLPNKNVRALAIDPRDRSTLYAGTMNLPPYYAGGASASHDGGATWTDINTGLPLDDEFVVMDIAVAYEQDQAEPTLYLGGAYEITPWQLPANWRAWMFKSVDGGEHWTESNKGLDFPEIFEVLVDPSDARTIYAGTRCGGVYRSTDAGNTWGRFCDGLRPYMITAMTAHPTDADTIVVGGEDDYYNGYAGVFMTFDGGMSWEARTQGMSPGTWWISGLAITHEESRGENVLFASVAGFRLYKSTDFGLSWTLDQRLPYWSVGVYVEPSAPSRVYVPIAGYEPDWPEIWLSNNCGHTWGVTAQSLVWTAFRGMAIEPGNADTAYAGTEWSGIYKTTDGGETWGLTGYPSDDEGIVQALAIDAIDTRTVYAGDSEWGSDTLGVMVSHDGGAEWEDYSRGLPDDARVEALAWDAVHGEGDGGYDALLYAATSAGVFRRASGDEVWAELNRGLIERSGRRLAVSPATYDAESAGLRAVYLGTDDGAWRLVPLADLDGDGVVNLSDLATLLAHYGQTAGVTLEDGDLDEDGDVDLSDLAALLGDYGER